MTKATQTRVYFLRVVHNPTKLQRICETVSRHFAKADRVLIIVPSIEAANYIDQLLWRNPEESFIPHIITNQTTTEFIAITTSSLNVNQANILLNLTMNVQNDLEKIEVVYELMDLTSPDKEKASHHRQMTYQQQGCLVDKI